MSAHVLVSFLGKTGKGYSYQNKITGLPERHNCPRLHGVSALGTISYLLGYYTSSVLREIETQGKKFVVFKLSTNTVLDYKR